MSGRKGIAPCGHPGSYVTANFITCDLRCQMKDASDGVPVEVDEEKTPKLTLAERCPYCGSYDIEPFTTYYFGQFTGKHCNPCGRVWP